MALKQSLAKACVRDLAQRARRRSEAVIERKTRQDAAAQGNIPQAFPSPKRTRSLGGTSARQLVPAMVLPRWESFDGFKSCGVAAGKLSMLKVYGDNNSQPRRLACMVCQKAVGGGETILALSCAHIFCPVCFEMFLRRRWAHLASNQVDSSETEHIPCPLCSTKLQRQDVHTLTEPEVIDLAARAELVHHLAAAVAIVPDRFEGNVSPESPSAKLAAVAAFAKAVAAAASQTVPSPKVSTTPVAQSPVTTPTNSSSRLPVTSPTNSNRPLIDSKVVSHLIVAKSAAAEAKDQNTVASPASISPKSVTSKHAQSSQSFPTQQMSPPSGNRPHNVQHVANVRQRTPDIRHRSLTMPVQPNDMQTRLQTTSISAIAPAGGGATSLAVASAQKLPVMGGGLATRPTMMAPALANPGTVRRTLTRNGIADNHFVASAAGGLQVTRPMQAA